MTHTHGTSRHRSHVQRLRSSVYYRRRLVACLTLGGGMMNGLVALITHQGANTLKFSLFMIVMTVWCLRSAFRTVALISIMLNIAVMIAVSLLMLTSVIR